MFISLFNILELIFKSRIKMCVVFVFILKSLKCKTNEITLRNIKKLASWFLEPKPDHTRDNSNLNSYNAMEQL